MNRRKYHLAGFPECRPDRRIHYCVGVGVGLMSGEQVDDMQIICRFGDGLKRLHGMSLTGIGGLGPRLQHRFGMSELDSISLEPWRIARGPVGVVVHFPGLRGGPRRTGRRRVGLVNRYYINSHRSTAECLS